jgi:hypothetical protein
MERGEDVDIRSCGHTIEAAINEHVQGKVKVPYAVSIATLRECCSDKKLGSRAKHALKDLTPFRLSHPAGGVLLLQLLVQVSSESLGKDERKIVRLVHFLLSRVVELHPDFAHDAIVAVERGMGKNHDLRLRISAIRTLGALSRGAETQQRVLSVLCEHLAQLQASDGKEVHKGKKKRFLLRLGFKDGGDAALIGLPIALIRSIRATGCAASARMQVLLGACRLKDVGTVRHVLAIMLQVCTYVCICTYMYTYCICVRVYHTYMHTVCV